MQNTIAIPTRPVRKFVPEYLIIDSWDKIKSLFDNLLEREISSSTELERWMLDQSELSAVLEEDMAWRYIKMNIDTTDKELAEKVIEMTGSKSKIIFKDLPKDDPMQRKPNGSLAKEKLNWEPKIQLEEGLGKTIAYFKELDSNST